MPRPKLPLLALLIIPVLLIFGAALAAQNASAATFTPLRTIGQNRPAGMIYDPNFDRFAWVDPSGQLVIVDAATLQPLHVIYPSGNYEAYNFSRNGQLLAVAVDTSIDVWDTTSGKKVASFSPTGALRVQGPLQFTLNDQLLVFDSIVPAPQNLRRSENDTVILPWVWDTAASRGQRTSVLVNHVAAYPFYNVRVSMIAGDNGLLVSGLDNRIQIYDAKTPSMKVIADLPAQRLETDPILAWHSATDPYFYVVLDKSGSAVQINTLTDAVTPLDLGGDLSVDALAALQNMAFSRVLQRIGDGTNQVNPLAQLLLGDTYETEHDFTPPVFHLLDMLMPLTDDPSTDPATRSGLLAFDFNDARGTGSLDLYHPSGINQIALSPNAAQVAVRRQSGQVELYDVATGTLQRVLTPSEPDPKGQYTFSYTGDGKTLLADFDRFDVATGQLLTHADSYTQPFDSYTFTSDDQLITFGGTPVRAGGALTWRLWDVQTGNLLREDSFNVQGDVIGVSDDKLRYLTSTTNGDGSYTLRIIDGRANSTQTITLPAPRGSSAPTALVPNADWTRFIVQYGGSMIAVYDDTGKCLYFDAGNNLPSNIAGVHWIDDSTIGLDTAPNSGLPATPILGIQYNPSGLPQCLVDAFPDDWQSFLPLWRSFLVNRDPDQLNAFTQVLCSGLTGNGGHTVNTLQGTPVIPANATAVAHFFTPTPTLLYLSARTPAPIGVPGVPACITDYYQDQAVTFADLWRKMTANVTDPQQLAQINQMICSGLLDDLDEVQPTPTINPNGLAVTTPTPMPSAPASTGGDQASYDEMAIDITTGARTVSIGLAPNPTDEPPDPLALVNDLFIKQYKYQPNDPVLSPDGVYLAARDQNGFVDIYQLDRPLPTLVAQQATAAATQTGTPVRSIGLAPTATQPPQELGAAQPSLTPTVTLTPIPFTQNDHALQQWGQSQSICAAPKLASIAHLPSGFNPPGTLLVAPLDKFANSGFLWTLDPITGKVVGNVDLPQCGVKEKCIPSPDGLWIVRQGQGANGAPSAVVISHIDGSEAFTLYSPPEVALIKPNFSWSAPHTLEISYNGVLPTVSPEQIPLITTYNPDIHHLSSGSLPPTEVPISLLAATLMNRQPYGTLEVVVQNTPNGVFEYLRDATTGSTQVFAQGDLGVVWQPAGRFLYYSPDNFVHTFVYDTLTQQFSRLGSLPLNGGVWSPDGHLLAHWLNPSAGFVNQALYQGQQPGRLEVWDSDTGLMRVYCIPELGTTDPSTSSLVWSPDSRYLAFTTKLLVGGDIKPTPTFVISPEVPPPTLTPVPLEAQYDYQSPRTIILDTASGIAVIASDQASAVQSWIDWKGD